MEGEDYVLGEKLKTAVRNVYKQHRVSQDSRSCDLEKQLPLRDPFFLLKRVPRFRVRTDLHSGHYPAYLPLSRLENASVDDLSEPNPQGCHKILLEGDIGTGKSTLCYRLLHNWEMGRISGQKVSRDSQSLLVYVDCAFINNHSFRSKQKVRDSFYIVSKTLSDMSAVGGIQVPSTVVYDWAKNNGSKISVMFDNVAGSSDVIRHIENIIDSQKLKFSRVMVVTTPGLMRKNMFDCMYYCYGLHPDYSNKVLIKRLRKGCERPHEKLAAMGKLDFQCEFLRNPLSATLLAFALTQTGNDIIPRHRSELLSGLMKTALARVFLGSFSRCRSSEIHGFVMYLNFLGSLAYDGLVNKSHYFSRTSLPVSIQTKHVCDFFFIHDIHGVLSEKLYCAFTNRSIRDFLAARYFCGLLKTDQDRFLLQSLIESKVYSSLSAFCCRQLTMTGDLETLNRIFDGIVGQVQLQYVKMDPKQPMSRGWLRDLARVLDCLRETDYTKPALDTVAQALPTVLEFSCNDCSKRTIEDFISVATKTDLPTQGVILNFDGMFIDRQIGVNIARALNAMTSLTTLMVRATSVTDTGFLVGFLCETFKENTHTKNFTLAGPLNLAENLNPSQHNCVRSVFNDTIALKSITLENVGHHHRMAYIIRCWPVIFERIEIRKCNLEAASDDIITHIQKSKSFQHFRLESCYIPASKLREVLWGLKACPSLQTLHLNLLSGKRHFSVDESKRVTYRPALDAVCCPVLCDVIATSPVLEEISLCENGIDDDNGRLLLSAVAQSLSVNSVDLTGNTITDDVIGCVLDVITKRNRLKCLLLGSNCFTKEGRRTIVRATIEHVDLKLSL